MNQLLSRIIVTLLFSLPILAGAHGSATHVLGTVTEASNDQVTIQTPKGKKVTIAFSPDTILQQNGITTDTARPQVGSRLIAEAAKIKGKLVAVEVKFASPKKK